MASQFTHRQDSKSSNTSICVKCFRVVATRERESELRADEALHSCRIALPGAKPDPIYWGILCRRCVELVAFSTSPIRKGGPGAENSRAGAIRCSKDHTHIYFPRDFQLYPSSVAIAEETLQLNLAIYKAINPSWESSSGPQPVEPGKRQSGSDLHAQALDEIEVVPAALSADPRRESAGKAARVRWANWALKKTS